jgi:hypothetical protein
VFFEKSRAGAFGVQVAVAKGPILIRFIYFNRSVGGIIFEGSLFKSHFGSSQPHKDIALSAIALI